MTDLLNQTLGSYAIEALLGTRATGRVFRARHVRLGRPAALMVFDRSLATAPDFQARFQDELRRVYKIEAPIIPWPERPKRLLRVSAQLYNSLPQYEKLAVAMRKIFFQRKSK